MSSNNQNQMVNKIVKTVRYDADSQNRRFIWDLFIDGSARSREITQHTRYAGSMVQTWSEFHPAGSDMAGMIAKMK